VRILVAGGAGFIGLHLCKVLVSQGHQVTCLDNYLTSYRKNLSHIPANQNITFLAHDICRPLGDHAYDLAFHLASPAIPAQCERLSIETMSSNIVGAQNLLELGVPLIFVSSIRVLDEASKEIYVMAKRGAELLCEEYAKRGSSVQIVRFFNVFGDQMRRDDSRVVPQFIQRALRGEPLMIYQGGMQREVLLHVDDAVVALLQVKPGNPTINVGGTTITIRNLAEMIIRLTDSQSQICDMASDRKHADKALWPMDDLPGWKPASLEVGLLRTIKYFRSLT